MAGNNPLAPVDDAIAGLFGRLGRPVFDMPGGVLGDRVPQQAGGGDGNIQPVGWVQNASSAGSATVVIDQTGITINDGALILNDLFGQNVITGGGFGTSWLSFLESGGVYNSDFGVGTTNNITKKTIVGTASTTADYLASLSSDIPYWVISSVSAGGTSIGRSTQVNAPSGYQLAAVGGFDFEIFQDVPVTPGQFYEVLLNWYYSFNGASEFDTALTIDFRDTDHAQVGAGSVSTGLSYTVTNSAFKTEAVLVSGLIPAGVKYIRVYLRFYQVSGIPTVRIGKVVVNSLARFSTMSIQSASAYLDFFSTPYDGASSLYPKLRLSTGGTISIGPGGTTIPSQVVGARRTGWTAPTGTAQRGTFATDTVTLINLARAVKALIDDLTTHGLIGA